MFYRLDGYLSRENKLYVPDNAVCELLVQQAQGGGLMGHFGVKKTLDVARIFFFFWLKTFMTWIDCMLDAFHVDMPNLESYYMGYTLLC